MTANTSAIITSFDDDGHMRAAFGDRDDTIQVLMAGVGLFETRHRTTYDNLD